ncbi:MAG: gfo/Idh/MocA family oxidoreductase [Ruminococcaceae bacterium]|nr:gfo/Idh/MocA family oxidoreductase [Oscillospiraceae bacterium]
MKKLKIALIGLGQRGRGLLNNIVNMDDIEIVAVCDEYADRNEDTAKFIQEKMGNTPITSTNSRDIISIKGIEAVVISAAWEAHVDLAVSAMRAGIYVGLEVGGGYDVEDCWRLVRTSEETGIPCMMLENCCYGQNEMMCLNLAKKGIFGEIVHCDGGYRHDLCNEILSGNEIRHYRLRNYMLRNCDNYPTHQLGPICKLLNINNGNRMVSLVSVASKSVGLQSRALETRGADDTLSNTRFIQGDVVTTIIRCAGGETIKLTLDTTLPRPYSRGFVVCGTKGCFEEANQSLFLEENDAEKYEKDDFDWSKSWGNVKEYAKTYDHPLWKRYQEEGVKEGHGGMDWLVLRAFFESAAAKIDPPIDVYDAAAWMSISTLSEDSIAMGGLPVAIPDFTRGKWVNPKPKKYIEDYRLDIIPDIK